MIKREFDGLFEMFKSDLYIIIINEEDIREHEKKREMKTSQKE